MNTTSIAFIGGGHMASALVGGLLRSGRPPSDIVVVEPLEAQRDKLARDFGLAPRAAVDDAVAAAATLVWAVKPQSFAEAAAALGTNAAQALHISVMAGVRCESIAAASGATRLVRAMPNTPALIGRGIAGLYASPAVDAAARTEVEALFAPTGEVLWVDREPLLDAVTALSGSGPAYVFYFVEAMVQAGRELGLAPAQARRLAEATFSGAAALCAQSALEPEALRAQVTSKGGTTQAAVGALDEAGVKAAFVRALHAAARRAEELGR